MTAAMPTRRPACGGEDGQALVLLVGALCAVLVGAVVLGGVARALGDRGDGQRAADLAALAAARGMRDAYPRLFEPPVIDGAANPRHLTVAAYRAHAVALARLTAARNGAERVSAAFPDAGTGAPLRVRVTVADPLDVPGGREVEAPSTAEAEVVPPAALAGGAPGPGDYHGPLAERQGQRMRPDVALAFDRMEAAARADGVALVITSGFRSTAEQAVLWARNPDPTWVAPPGRSLHRLGTELDLGPNAAWPWLAGNARRFGFVQRYSWEPWHFGYARNAGSASVGFGADGRRSGGGAIPSFVPARYVQPIQRAAMRWNVGAALLAAQLRQESGFDPAARSPAGAQGIAQFMPGTAAAMGLRDPFDPRAAIDAQAHLMRDLLRSFGTVPLALAAYNAGPHAVGRCMCIPPYPETQQYVAAILATLAGAGDLATPLGLDVRLVR